MRMQAELCRLMVRDPSLSVTKVGDWPGKAQKAKGIVSRVGFTPGLGILMPEQALGRRSEHKAGFQWVAEVLQVDLESCSLIAKG